MGEVQFKNVKKRYEESVVAVKDFNLRIEDGEFVSIVGPSGSGKSTLLRMIAGLEDITQGEILIDGRVMNNVAPSDRNIAMVFQNYALYPHMTVKENMSYGLRYSTSLSQDEIKQKVRETAEMMDIEELLGKRPDQLSGGQQQRVATGRAIVRDPEVFLMDEPLSNLDAKLKMHMRTELQRIQNDLNTTTLYVTHDQEEAMTMSDRVIIIHQGELQQEGKPGEIYHNPSNMFVAEFIGSPAMNFFDVIQDGTTIRHDAFDYEVPREVIERMRTPAEKQLKLGIRPEAFRIQDEARHNTITGTVDVVEPVGSDDYVYLMIGSAECTVRTEQGKQLDPGNSVHIAVDPSDIYLFDSSTGENLLEG